MAYVKSNKKAEMPAIILSPIDRSYKGIEEWRTAIKAFENIYYPNRKKYYDLCREIILDAHLISLIGKRRSKVTNSRIKFFNADGSENEQICSMMETEAAEEMIKDYLDSRFFGHSLLWYNNIEGTAINYTLIDRAHVNPIRKEVLRQAYDMYGEPYNIEPVNNYVIEVGKPKDMGLLASAAIWVIYKKGGVTDYALFAESFGNPFREYIYDDVTTKPALEKAARETGASQFVVRPRNAEFKLHDTNTKSASNDLFIGLEELCDAQMSKLILHNTMTTDSKGGNYKGEVHAKSEEGIAKADKRFVIRILNEKFKRILTNYGYNVEGGHFAYEEEDSIPIEKRFEMDLKFAAKLNVEPEYFYNKYNMPVPKKGAGYVNQKTGEDNTDIKEISPDKSKEKPEKETKTDAKKLSDKPWYVAFKDYLFSLFPWAE
jgi:phage gp29-like protein